MTTDLLLGRVTAVTGAVATVRVNDPGSAGAVAPGKDVASSIGVGAMVKISVGRNIVFASVDRVYPAGANGEHLEAETSMIGEGALTDTGEVVDFPTHTSDALMREE